MQKNCPRLVCVAQAESKSYFDEMVNFIKMNNLNKDITLIKELQSEFLPIFYKKATAYIFPSSYEVFGLTMLEAMACGTPVLTSNVSAMPEICYDAAIYFNPLDEIDIASKIYSLLNDSNLKNLLIKKGKDRVKYFSWSKTAIKTLKVFEDVA